MKNNADESLVICILQFLKDKGPKTMDKIYNHCNLGKQNENFFNIFKGLGLLEKTEDFSSTRKLFKISYIGESFLDLLKNGITIANLIENYFKHEKGLENVKLNDITSE
ncbi:MAG: hypothetical protein ACTSVV_03450 [Promethearchaeota archaeon]